MRAAWYALFGSQFCDSHFPQSCSASDFPEFDGFFRIIRIQNPHQYSLLFLCMHSLKQLVTLLSLNFRLLTISTPIR
jgi:hypothetical protein